MSAQQVKTTVLLSEMSQQQAIMSDTLRQLVKELQRPHEASDTLAQLKQLLRPLVDSLAELSRKLPEPPGAS
jgi:macrodomain Ter protein organizer (MatP/YcbG family)